MKNAIIGLVCIIILLLAGTAISTAEGRTMRQNELSSSLSSAMQQSLEILTMSKDYEIEDEKQFAADFIQNALVKMNSDSSYEVQVYSVNTEKGMLDAEVTETYKQLFRPGKVRVRRVVVTDEYNNAKNDTFTVSFAVDDTVIKQLNVHGGDFLTAKMLPAEAAVTKWKLVETNTVYTADTISGVAVTQNLHFEAVK